MTCNTPLCSFTILNINIIDFVFEDTYHNLITESLENETIYITGNAIIDGKTQNNNIYIIDNINSTNIGYGITDINGDFRIPIYINGINEIDKVIDITCIGTLWKIFQKLLNN